MTDTSWDALINRIHRYTLLERAVRHIAEHPGQSACQMARVFGVKASSLSAALYRAVQDGTLVRTNGTGPRGGHTYRFPDDGAPK